MSAAMMLLAVAVVLTPGPWRVRGRIGPGRVAAPDHRPAEKGLLALAFSLDVLAICLRSGMTVAGAVLAVAPGAPPDLAGMLRRSGELLALGADASTAWTDGGVAAGPDREKCVALARLARRSADSGAALADSVAALARQCREDALDSAVSTAERAGVLVGAPLGLCFLPSFVCLGIVPVVLGLATDVFGAGVL